MYIFAVWLSILTWTVTGVDSLLGPASSDRSSTSSVVSFLSPGAFWLGNSRRTKCPWMQLDRHVTNQSNKLWCSAASQDEAFQGEKKIAAWSQMTSSAKQTTTISFWKHRRHEIGNAVTESWYDILIWVLRPWYIALDAPVSVIVLNLSIKTVVITWACTFVWFPS